jgi:CheY-like chemotaxis protein
MEKMSRILFVDDSLDDVELTLNAFKECGLADLIDVVYDGKEAIDYLFYRGQYTKRKKSVPVFVLLDLKMQKLNGSEVLKSIRKSKEYEFLPVVILSSSRLEADILQCYSAGANAYVVKPIDYKELVKTIGGIGFFWAKLNNLPFML